MNRNAEFPADTSAPGPNAPEHERALWWWENVVGLSRSELAERIGYSEAAITNMELGVEQDTGQPVGERAMLRYRLACAAFTLAAETSTAASSSEIFACDAASCAVSWSTAY